MSYKIVVWGKLIEKWVLDEESQEYNGQIELHSSEEDLVNYIRNNCSIKQGASYEGIAKEILSLLQGEKEQVIKLKNGSTIKIGGNEERLVGVDTPPKEEKSCIDCKHFKPTENLYQISVRCKQCIDKNGFEPKLKKQESPIDWEGLKTEESVSKMSNEEMRNELLKQIRKDNKLVDIVRSIYEKVEGEKK